MYCIVTLSRGSRLARWDRVVKVTDINLFNKQIYYGLTLWIITLWII